jgi:hypothetical protein
VRRHPGSTTALRDYSLAIARFAVAEPVEGDEDARSTCTQRDPRCRHVRRFAGQGTDAERRPTLLVLLVAIGPWWRRQLTSCDQNGLGLSGILLRRCRLRRFLRAFARHCCARLQHQRHNDLDTVHCHLNRESHWLVGLYVIWHDKIPLAGETAPKHSGCLMMCTRVLLDRVRWEFYRIKFTRPG